MLSTPGPARTLASHLGAAATALNIGTALGPLVMAAVAAGGAVGWLVLGAPFHAAVR